MATGFSLSGRQHFESEWFCCCTEPPLSTVHIQGVWEEVSHKSERKRSRER